MRRKQRARGGAKPHRAGEIHGQDALEHVEPVLVAALNDSRTVHEDVEAREAGDERIDVLLHRDVEPGRGDTVRRRRGVFRRKPAAMTCAPSSAIAAAIAAPMPCVPPVTNATLPSKRSDEKSCCDLAVGMEIGSGMIGFRDGSSHAEQIDERCDKGDRSTDHEGIGERAGALDDEAGDDRGEGAAEIATEILDAAEDAICRDEVTTVTSVQAPALAMLMKYIAAEM